VVAAAVVGRLARLAAVAAAVVLAGASAQGGLLFRNWNPAR
jgi:hypothetical protein